MARLLNLASVPTTSSHRLLLDVCRVKGPWHVCLLELLSGVW